MSMDSNKKFMVVEFSDGLQIVPTQWLNFAEQTCIWPSHFKTQLRINKAIITREMPKEQHNWKELPVKRMFRSADTYERSMEILIQAQDTSNVDETDMSSEERRERDKKRRRKKAKKTVDNFSETEEEVVNKVARENKENYQKQNKKEIRKNKKELPSFPQIEKFVSSTPLKEIYAAESPQEIENMSDNTLSSVLAGKDVMGPCNQNKRTTATNVHDDKENSSDQEFKKQVLLKLNKILYKQDRFENKLDAFDEKLQFKDNEINDECDLQFPLQSLEDLNEFEEQLQESQFKQKVLNTLRLVGGSTMHIMTSNILKKIMVNTLAKKYSWAGMKGKLVFKDLNLPKIIMQAVRLHTQYSHTTDAEFADSISKWLAQAPLRTQRQLKTGQQPEDK